ncbi:aldehyde dehydrogenase family protein [Halorubrum trueperi]|uniref:Aldehyde dehydrogenase family protein n=1 Tax=Halorubrum trueperi TaxID=2004704 RepID=A0ABD5UG69_9EURY
MTESSKPTRSPRERHADAAIEAFSTTEYGILIDGEWEPAATGETFAATDPTTGQEHAKVQDAGADDVDRAVTAANQGFEAWSDITPRERATYLQDIADAIRDERDRLAQAITLDVGRPLRESKGEVPQVADRFDYFAGLARDITGETIPAETHDFVLTFREPYGVVGAIVPWNVPHMLTANKLAPALAAGNSVVLKPAEQASPSTLELVRIIDDVLPDGVVNAVTGFGDTGAALVEHPDVPKIAFTGSGETGKQVMRSGAAAVKSVTLELGGKGPAIVFPDADLEKAVEDIMMGIYFNAGQICGATARLYLHQDIADEFLDRFVSKSADLEIGDPLVEGTRLGPIVDESQHEDILEYIHDARERGATVLTGGGVPEDSTLPDGWFVEPTVLTDVPQDAPAACEEIFGPVEIVEVWSDYDDVIQRANDSKFGLTAGVWTDDYRTLIRATKDLEAGTITGNLAHRLPTEMPYGGTKQSGTGRENGREVLSEYTELKSLNADLREGSVGIY